MPRNPMAHRLSYLSAFHRTNRHRRSMYAGLRKIHFPHSAKRYQKSWFNVRRYKVL